MRHVWQFEGIVRRQSGSSAIDPAGNATHFEHGSYGSLVRKVSEHGACQ